MNRVSIFQDGTGSRKILQRCMRHRVLCVIAKMTSARTSVKFIARMGNGPRREEKISGTQEREARKFNGTAGVISKLLHTPCIRNRVFFSNPIFIMDFLKRLSWALIECHFSQQTNSQNSLNVTHEIMIAAWNAFDKIIFQ